MPKESVGALPRYLHSLGVLRGLAAVCVVFWHWQHFFYQGSTRGSYDIERLPFFAALAPLYLEGGRAVHFFFSLSGFLFTWLYAQRIASGEVSLRTFAVLRLSRLYPLHLATLLLVAAFQAIWYIRRDEFFVYRFNDAYHFALNLGLLSGLGAADGLSFNGPAWSLSVEMFLYAVFFALSALRFRAWWHQLLFVILGIGLLHAGAGPMSVGLVAFFMGSIAYLGFARATITGISTPLLTMVSAAALLAWVAVATSVHFGWLVLHTESLNRSIPGTVWSLTLELVVFPLTICAVALGEAWWGGLGKRFAMAGAISYSAYLLHFPLQLVFVALHRTFAADVGDGFFYSPWSVVVFLGLLLPLSRWVNRHVEIPAQTYLRNRLIRRGVGVDHTCEVVESFPLSVLLPLVAGDRRAQQSNVPPPHGD